MSETAVAVETAINEAFQPPAEPAAPQIVRRDDVRAQILSQDWKEEPELVAQRGGDAPAEGSGSPAEALEGAEGASGQGESSEGAETSAEPEFDLSEPPAEAVIGEGGNRVVVRTPDGKYAAAPDVKLQFQVGDKIYLKSPAELVRMARDGVAGQQFREEVKQYREAVPQLAQRLESMESELEAQRALNLELLTDESRYLARREEWDRLNSPEERLRRIEAEREYEFTTRRAQQEEAQRRNVILSYYTQEVKPVQDDLLAGFPEVSLEAKMGRIALDTAPLLVNGIIPPERLPEYKAYLNGPFREWVQSEAAKRSQAETQRRTQLDTERRKAQTVVQSVGRQLAPNGKAAPDAPPPRPKPRNREEAKQAILGRNWQDF
jgi:hypothetical protein